MPLMASRGASATMTIAGVGDPLSPQTGPLVLRIKELEEQHLAFRNSLICAFNQLLDLKDISTGVHSTRLAEWAIRVARKLNIPEEHLYQVEVAARLHDVGKIGVPDAILKKQGPLTTVTSKISYRMMLPSAALLTSNDCSDCGNVVHTDGAPRSAVTVDRGRSDSYTQRTREQRDSTKLPRSGF